jgi:rsbT co-antagonist protein RsbR
MNQDATFEYIQAENHALHQENEAMQRRITELEGLLVEAQHKEQMLNQSQQLFQLIIDNLPESVFWKDTDLIYHGCNKSFAIDAGVGEPANIVGKSDYDLAWTTEQAAFFREVDQRVMEQDEAVYHIIESQRQADGKEAWLDTNKIPLHDNAGNVIGLLGTYEDITERKQMQEELLQSRALLQGIIDNAPMAILVKDAEGYYKLSNQYAASLVQLTPAELVNKTDYDLFPHDVAQEMRAEDQQIIATGKTAESEQEVTLADGLHAFFKVKFPIYDAHGTAYAVGGFMTDITERRRAMDDLRTFKALADYAPDGFALASLQGEITYANAAYETLAGYGAATVGMRVIDFYASESHADLQQAMQTILQEGSWQGELLHQREDGSTFEALTSGFLIRDEQERPEALAAIVRDVSEQRRAEEERTTLQQQLIEAQQSAIRELSSPLIPLTQHVVLMPLIGSVDSTRAQQVMEALLEGIAYHQAEVAILDITGVSVVDTQVANALIQTARAVQLLGAQIILTGIGPTMAQTLVHLGVDLSSMQTRASLQRAVLDVLAVQQT